MATIGENIRRLRIAAGFAEQKPFAEALSVPQSRVSDWEHDRYGLPDTATLIKMAKTLGVSIDALLSGIDPHYDFASSGQPQSTFVQESRPTYGRHGALTDGRPDELPVIAEGEPPPSDPRYWDGGKPIRKPTDSIARPLDVSDRHAYGVLVRGHSMQPIFRPGMCLVASPHAAASNGDEVYVTLKTGECCIAIAREVPAGWLLETASPAHESRFAARDDVSAMHVIVWSRRAVRQPAQST